MSTNLKFPFPKDPEDVAWYYIPFKEKLSSVTGSSTAPSSPKNLEGIGSFRTPGDSDPASPLTADQAQLTSDKMAVAVRIGGGTPGQTYAVRVDVLTETGSSLHRSAILNVTGL